MFEFITSGRNRRRRIELTNEELNGLMCQISEAEDFRSVEKQFNLLYDGTVNRMWELLSKKFVPPLTQEDVRDVFQDAWIKILDWRHKYDRNFNAFSWIYVIKKNMLIDKVRQFNRNYIDRIEDDERDIIEEIPVTGFDFFDDMTSNETVNIIVDAIKSIDNPKEREILERRLIEEQKLEFISKEMGIPLATVYKIIKNRINEMKPKIEYLLNN